MDDTSLPRPSKRLSSLHLILAAALLLVILALAGVAQADAPATQNLTVSGDLDHHLASFPFTTVELKVLINDTGHGDGNATVAEWFVDIEGENGTGTAMTLLDGLANSTEEWFVYDLNISGWAFGESHIFHVHGVNESGNWSAFATVNVTIPAIDAIDITDNAGAVGNTIPDGTAEVGQVFLGYAAAFNGSDFIGNVEANWSVENGSGATAQTLGNTNDTNSMIASGITGGSAYWNATYADKIGNVTVTILPPEIDYIRVNQAPGDSAAIPDQNIPLNTSITGYAAAYNDTIGHLADIQGNWTVNGTSSLTEPTGSDSGSSVFNSGGVWGLAMWKMENSTYDLNDTVVFTVSDNLGPNAYWAAANGETIAHTLSYPFADSIVINGTFNDFGRGGRNITQARYCADTTTIGFGNCTVVYMYPTDGTFDSPLEKANASIDVSGWVFGESHTYYMQGFDGINWGNWAPVTVTKPSVDSVMIVETANSGVTETQNQVVWVGQTLTGYAAAFNGSTYIGDVPCEWIVENTSGAEAATAGTGVSTADILTGTTGGTAYWNITYGTLNDSVTLTISPPGIDIIRMNSASGDSLEVLDQDAWIGDTIAGYAAGYNSSTGLFVANIPADWSENGSTAHTVPAVASQTSTLGVGSEPGLVEWKIEYGSLEDTALITVLDNQGPATSWVRANGDSPLNLSTSQGSFLLNGTVSELDRGNGTVQAAEYFINDSVPSPTDYGAGIPITPTDGAYGNITESVNYYVSTAAYGVGQTLTVWVHGKDSFGNWGVLIPINITIIDNQEPVTSEVRANGAESFLYLSFTATSFQVSAAISDSGLGNSPISGAEYFINEFVPLPESFGNGGVMQAADGAFDGAVEAVSAEINTGEFLIGQTVTIWVHGQDNASNWGNLISVKVKLVDDRLPVTQAVYGDGNNPHLEPYLDPGFVLNATISDAGRGYQIITKAEYFMQADSPVLSRYGTGYALNASDGYFDSPVEAVDAFIDTSSWPVGESHTFWLHGHDGTAWGAFQSVQVTIVDRLAPSTVSVLVNGESAAAVGTLVTSLILNASISDLGLGDANVTEVEYFTGNAIPDATQYGTGTSMQPVDGDFDSAFENATAAVPFSAGAQVGSNVTFWVHGRDTAGNWGEPKPVSVTITDDVAPSVIQAAANGQTALFLGASVGKFTLEATASDMDAGNQSIQNIIYFLDSPGGTPVALWPTDGRFDNHTEDGNITIDTSNWAIGEGHDFIIQAFDGTLWSESYRVNVTIYDNMPPETMNIRVDGMAAGDSAVDVWEGNATLVLTFDATDDGAGSRNISRIEYFLETPGTNGTGIAILPDDAAFDQSAERANIELDISSWASGSTHTLYIHAYDGTNWGLLQDVEIRVIESDTQDVVDNDAGGTDWLPIIIIALIIAGVVLLLVLLLRSKKTATFTPVKLQTDQNADISGPESTGTEEEMEVLPLAETVTMTGTDTSEALVPEDGSPADDETMEDDILSFGSEDAGSELDSRDDTVELGQPQDERPQSSEESQASENVQMVECPGCGDPIAVGTPECGNCGGEIEWD